MHFGHAGTGPVPSARRHRNGGELAGSPTNRWAVWHVRELIPTQTVSRGHGPVLPLAARVGAPDLAAVDVVRADGTTGTVADVLADTYTDAFVVAHDGELTAEAYAAGGGPDQVHAVLSVAKSVVGCAAGVLVDRGELAPERWVTDYVPELETSGYVGATVRDLLDMRSRIRFVEDYTNPRDDLRRMHRWVLGRGRLRGEGLYSFLTTLGADRPHGGHFLYRS